MCVMFDRSYRLVYSLNRFSALKPNKIISDEGSRCPIIYQSKLVKKKITINLVLILICLFANCLYICSVDSTRSQCDDLVTCFT